MFSLVIADYRSDSIALGARQPTEIIVEVGEVAD
jgi:hypothetical protein